MVGSRRSDARADAPTGATHDDESRTETSAPQVAHASAELPPPPARATRPASTAVASRDELASLRHATSSTSTLGSAVHPPPSGHASHAVVAGGELALHAASGGRGVPSSEPASQAPDAIEPEAAAGERRSKLESDWHSQPHDPARSHELQTYLQQTAAALELPSDVVKASDCGSSVCKVRLQFASIEEASRFEQAAQAPDFRYEVKPTALPAMPKLGPAQLAALGLAPASAPHAAAPVPAAPAVPEVGEVPVVPGQAPADTPPVELEVMLEMSQNDAHATQLEQGSR
jgi:hypothetical protein